MDLNEANRFKVYVLESLEGNMHTGQNLYDYANLKAHTLGEMGIDYKKIPLAQQLAAMEHAFPEMKPYIENAGIGLYVLYL